MLGNIYIKTYIWPNKIFFLLVFIFFSNNVFAQNYQTTVNLLPKANFSEASTADRVQNCAHDTQDSKNTSTSGDNITCLIVEYEPIVKKEGLALWGVLKLRLAKYGVWVIARSSEAENFDPNNKCLWFVHVRKLSSKYLLMAMDNHAAQKGDDVVIEIKREPKIEDTAWTMGLIVEETVAPYLRAKKELAALGAGLAIIEPKVVGGIKKQHPLEPPIYPQIRTISLSLGMLAISSLKDIVVGSRISIEGLFSKQTVASLSVGWMGKSQYSSKQGVVGEISMLPVEIMFGYIFFNSKKINIMGSAGFSLGFAIYKTRTNVSEYSDITMTFQPGANTKIKASFKITNFFAVYIDGGCNIPFVKDVLINREVIIYRQGWIAPIWDVGIQMIF